MNKVIYRNVAIVSAIFIVTFSIMLVTNYFQVRGSTPLGTEVMETLIQFNVANPDNQALQEQIRELDLMARKAYFVKFDRLMNGVYILLGMLALFLLCARGYYEGYKNIPDKDIDPVDEWAIKTKARKYVVWSVSGLAATALIFVAMSSPHLRSEKAAEAEQIQFTDYTPEQGEFEDGGEILSDITTDISEDAETDEEEASETEEVEQPTSRVNHHMFRGPNSNGHSQARNVPVRWNLSARTNIAWRQDVPRKGYSSPVVTGNRVFITGADDEARELYCYDLNTGELLWTLAATNIPGSPSQMPETYDEFMLASPTVATNGTYVVALFATGDLIGADMNGNRVWARNLGVPSHNMYGHHSALLLFNNTIIVQYDNRPNPRIMAVDIATGTERWSIPRTERESWSSPMIAYTANNTPQLIVMGIPNLAAYNPNNGALLWRINAGFMGDLSASAASANGIVFAASEYADLYAVNPLDGTVLWKDNIFTPELASPVATRDYVYIATGYGVFAAYNAQTGELHKEHELGAPFWSSPMIVEGKIYLFNKEGKMHLFTLDEDFRLIDSFDTGEVTWATPAFLDGKIVVRTERGLYAVTR